jgi:hypothetical protein
LSIQLARVNSPQAQKQKSLPKSQERMAISFPMEKLLARSRGCLPGWGCTSVPQMLTRTLYVFLFSYSYVTSTNFLRSLSRSQSQLELLALVLLVGNLVSASSSSPIPTLQDPSEVSSRCKSQAATPQLHKCSIVKTSRGNLANVANDNRLALMYIYL